MKNTSLIGVILYLLVSSQYSNAGEGCQSTNIDISGTWNCVGSSIYDNGSTATSNSTIHYTTADGLNYQFTEFFTVVQTAPEGKTFTSEGTPTLAVYGSATGRAVLNGSKLNWWDESAYADTVDPVDNYHGISRVSEFSIQVVADSNPDTQSSSNICIRAVT